MKHLLAAFLLLAACRPQPPVAAIAPPPETLDARLVRDDFTFAQWRATLGREPTPADLATLLDALAAARKQAPGRAFALEQDGELRLRVLRTPKVQAKGMVVLGIAPPEGVPDVKQLLHTEPGDNCPVCRMRAQMEKAGNGL